jgi:hypothetical protein
MGIDLRRTWDDFKKRLDPRRGQLGKIDLLYPITQAERANKATQQALQVQQEAVQTQIRQQEQQVARQRRSAVRQSIVARSRARAQAATQQQLGGSGYLGGMASLSSQLGSNLGYGSMMSGLSTQYTALTGQAAYLQGRAQMFSAESQLGFQLYSMALPFATRTLGGLFQSTSPAAITSDMVNSYP